MATHSADMTTPPNITAEPAPVTDIYVPGHHWVFLVLLLVIFVSVIGNVLVCLAIMTEKKLHCATNYFLLSMAVADIMVALLVMPMALIKYIFGMWLLGSAMCKMWVTLDVLCCTASIMHICTISLDRYLAICNPFTTQRRSRFQTPGKIVIVWMISILLCCPIFVLGFVSTSDVLNVQTCVLTNRLFMIYGSIIAFYIPLVIVVVTYGRTVHALNKQARAFTVLQKNKDPSTNSTGKEASRQMSILYKAISCNHPCLDTSSNTLDDYSPSNTSVKLPEDDTPLNDGIKILNEETPTLNGSPGILHAPNQLSKPVCQMRRSTSGSTSKGSSSKINMERKASKVLGVVFAVFVIGWTPFFFTNFLFALCSSCEINPTLFSIFEWLGWASSMVNPFIYTIFNKTFQKTFWKLLTCWCSAKKRTPQQSLNRLTTVNEVKSPGPKHDLL